MPGTEGAVEMVDLLLLGSALMKILLAEDGYVDVAFPQGVMIDGWFSVSDGLTGAELDAMIRVQAGDGVVSSEQSAASSPT